MRGWVWRLYLGAGALATGVCYLLPPGPRAVLNVVVGASAVAAIVVGVAWHRPARRLAWWLIAVAPALLSFQRLLGADIQVAAIAGAWTVLFVLVITRMAGLVRGIERSEAERRRLLDQTMNAAEQERIHIAAELHDGPIQRLSVLSYDLERAKQGVLANPVAVAGWDTPRPPSPPRSRGCVS